ncbi:hypothetical protein [Nocardia sp. SC052]|uniref:hypothetical protein n=1 Tax=Nocardia sichangensis TaxID=3385975 RepID=UPI00399F8B15
MRGDYDRPKNRSYVQNRRTVHGVMSRAGHITARDSEQHQQRIAFAPSSATGPNLSGGS